MADLMGLYRFWNPQYRNYTVYNQDHLAKVLLGWPDEGPHDAIRSVIICVSLMFCVQIRVQAVST
jgi:hypothetical protein